jgi:hypothetical protein
VREHRAAVARLEDKLEGSAMADVGRIAAIARLPFEGLRAPRARRGVKGSRASFPSDGESRISPMEGEPFRRAYDS